MAVVQDIERDCIEPSALQKSKDGSINYSSSSSSSTDSDSERSPLLSSQHSVTLPNYGSRQDSQTDSIPIESPSTGVFAIIGLLLIGTFISNADSTVVLATYGTISSEFNALQIGGWLTTSFTLASTAVQPSVGKLSDIYGRKPVLLISYALFGLGTVMIGIAQSMWQVILGRIISGFGGAGMTVIVSILITDLVPMIQVASWRSYVNVVSTLGRSIGGPLGGVLADTVGWRWSFIGQGPIILLAIILVALKLPSTTGPNTNTNINTDSDLSSLNTQIKGQPSKLRRIDFIGAFLLAITLITFLGALSIGGQQVPWSHPIILLLLGSSVILCILFLTYEANWAIEPVLPPSLLTKYDVAECYARTTLQVAAQLSMMFSVPLYFKVTQNASNTTAGAHLFPAVLGNTLGGLLAGYTIQKTGRYKSLTVIAHAVSAVGYLLLVLRWKGNTSWLQSLDIIPGGLGTGLNGAATFIALTSSIERKDIAVATGGMFLFASIGTISGIAISSAIQQTSLKHLLEEGLRDVGRNVGTGPGRKGRLRIIRDVIRDVENVQKLEGKVKEVVIQAYVKSLEYSHVFSLVCAVVALGLAVISREYRLK